MNKEIEFHSNFAEIKMLISRTRQKTLSVVNEQLIVLYWNVGKYIFEKINNSQWGEKVVTQLATYLTNEEPELKGFSSRNLFRMKLFYKIYRYSKIVTTVSAQILPPANKLVVTPSPLFQNIENTPLTKISWSHHVEILNKAKFIDEREYYILFIKYKIVKKILIIIMFLITGNICFAQKLKTNVIATIFDTFNGDVSKNELIENGKIEIKSKLNLDISISEFTLVTSIKGYKEYATSYSDTVSTEMQKLIKKCHVGQLLIFYNIKTTDTCKINPIFLWLSDKTQKDTLKKSFSKVTIGSIYDGKISYKKLQTIDNLEIITENEITKIKQFTMWCNCRVYAGPPTSYSNKLTSLMQNLIKKSNNEVFFYNIKIIENDIVKLVPPIYIEFKKNE